MDKYVILLPLKHNDGSPVPISVLQEAQDELYLLANGYTLDGTVEGAYRMKNGKKQTDTLLKIWVLIEPGRAGDLRELVRKFCVRLGQECIWFEKSLSVVEFVEGHPSQGAPE